LVIFPTGYEDFLIRGILLRVRKVLPRQKEPTSFHNPLHCLPFNKTTAKYYTYLILCPEASDDACVEPPIPIISPDAFVDEDEA